MLWGIDCLKSAPKFAIERAVNDVNAAMQMVWNQANDRNYWSTLTLDLTVPPFANQTDIPDNVQNVTGPCINAETGQPLTPVGTLAELDGFIDLYLDGDVTVDPIAYHIDRHRGPGTDPAWCIFRCAPPAGAAGAVITLDVVTEPPRYTSDDLSSCPLLPIPHQYVESLLLPIARYRASSFTMLFQAHDRQPTIDREYAEARIALGLADPLPGNAGDNFPDRKEPAKS